MRDVISLIASKKYITMEILFLTYAFQDHTYIEITITYCQFLSVYRLTPSDTNL